MAKLAHELARAIGNSVDTMTETVFTTDMTNRNFADTTNYSIEQVWGGPCDHHNCKGDCVAFITINFADGGSVGGYFCRQHLNEYEVAYGLPRTACKHAFSNTTSECHFCGAKAWAA